MELQTIRDDEQKISRERDDNMGQAEIINFLQKCKKPVSAKEITDKLKISGVTHSLRKLLFHNEIKCIEINRIQAKKFFNKGAPTRRMRLYYI